MNKYRINNNEYNPTIFLDRIMYLYDKVYDYIKLNNVDKIYILGLGDYLSGIIHTTIRIENRECIDRAGPIQICYFGCRPIGCGAGG